MALPSSGPISIGEIWAETATARNNPPSSLYSDPTFYGGMFLNLVNLNDASSRRLAGYSTQNTQISLSDWYGKDATPDFNLGISASKGAQFYSAYSLFGYGIATLGYSTVGGYGGLSNTSWKGTTITSMTQSNVGWQFGFSIEGTYASNGWTSITVNGASGAVTLQRSQAAHSYSVGGLTGSAGSTTWIWSTPFPGVSTSPPYNNQIVPGPKNTAWSGNRTGSISIS